LRPLSRPCELEHGAAFVEATADHQPLFRNVNRQAVLAAASSATYLIIFFDDDQTRGVRRPVAGRAAKSRVAAPARRARRSD
jgi:hypothetical protein